MLNIVSACAGIGCAHEALKRANVPIKNYFAFEIDKYAIAVNQYHHDYTTQLGDLNNWKEHIKTIGEPDLLIGSTPCQNLSCAGNGKGLEGSESRLFWKFYEMFNYWKGKPFIFENVASMKNSDRHYISNLLGVEPIMINAALVSAQNRKRYFWTNIEGIEQPEDKGIFLKDILERGVTKENKSYCLTSTYANAVPRDMLKNQRTQVFETIRLESIGKGGQGNRIYSINGKGICLSTGNKGIYQIDLPDGDYFIRKLTPIECERLMTLPDNYTALGNFNGEIKPISNTQRYKMCGNGIVVDVLKGIFSSFIKLKKENLCVI